jgi:EAL domain-containing protein (putative c-di-GMP-specific phosphodiesterase class I)
MLDSLKKKLPRNAMLCQYNTNEYMILLRGRIAEDKLNQFANALLDTIETPLAVGSAEDGTIVINALMGIVIYPLNGTNEKDLFNNAEMALYMSKKEGKSRYTIFNDNLSKTEQTNLAYYREIKEAMRKKEFAFYYHPIINTSNDTISFIEAFIRWNHPVLGVLPPNKFLTIMEHSGDINWVGRWGIEELCKQLLEWKKIYPSMDFRLSFNLSPKQLLDPKICEDFLAICKANRVETSKIVLEIVEFAIFEKYGIVAENIEKFDKLGFTIAIDDFGVEANTLARLSTLPIKIVKLDKKFIETSKENFVITKIVNMLVEIANNEHLEIVAEGVEDYDVMTYIKGFNIFECQGYAFTKPLDAKGMQKYIGQETWKDVTAGRRVIEKPETKPEMPLDEEPKIADAEEKAPEEVKEEVTEETK